jgi:hypothetical protein
MVSLWSILLLHFLFYNVLGLIWLINLLPSVFGNVLRFLDKVMVYFLFCKFPRLVFLILLKRGFAVSLLLLCWLGVLRKTILLNSLQQSLPFFYNAHIIRFDKILRSFLVFLPATKFVFLLRSTLANLVLTSLSYGILKLLIDNIVWLRSKNLD